MLCLRKPSEQDVRQYILDRENSPFSYDLINKTSEHICKDSFEGDISLQHYDIDHHRVVIGKGEECFRKAAEALKQWKTFDLPWVTLCFPDTPIEVGSMVAILSYQIGFWVVSFCRIVYVVDGWEEDGTSTRFGFAYGTLADHVERGEERFLIEWSHENDEVYYDILSFSRPGSWVTQLGYPVARYFQVRFAEESTKSLLKAIGATTITQT